MNSDKQSTLLKSTEVFINTCLNVKVKLLNDVIPEQSQTSDFCSSVLDSGSGSEPLCSDAALCLVFPSFSFQEVRGRTLKMN